MVNFESKTLQRAATLGERLRDVRQQSHVSVEEAAQATGISGHYLTALEDGNYQALPGDVYTRNFLRLYARYLKINEDLAVSAYDTERAVVKPTERRLPGPLAQAGGVSLTVLAKRVGIGLVLAAIIGYLAFEINSIIAPPPLVVDSPATSGVSTSPTIEVRGHTNPGVAVVVNGQSVNVSSSGAFVERLDLTVGRNTIQVTAVKKRGQRFTVTRDIIVEAPAPAPPFVNQ